jgi:hypothetical protein
VQIRQEVGKIGNKCIYALQENVCQCIDVHESRSFLASPTPSCLFLISVH